jgi:hypothetical protein
MNFLKGMGSRENLLPVLALSCTLLLASFFAAVCFAAAPESAGASSDLIRLGERMYRSGLLPSGEPLRAQLKGNLPVPGTTFACASCHLRSGLGSFEENVHTLAINGASLYKPLIPYYKGAYPLAALRAAYTDDSLLAAIRTGKDASGRLLSETMPRYQLDDSDARILLAYLKTLSVQFSPGVTDTTISFATVVTDEVSQQERDSLLSRLNQYVNLKNNQSRLQTGRGGNAKSRLMAENMMGSKELAAKNLSLSVWVLKGAPETWRSQLEEYYRKSPVFAILGGISHSDWQPVHRFSEEHGIPCLFPITDFPTVSEADWYTLYLSKGYYQEGESAARHLAGTLRGERVVQIVRDSPQGRALAAGFMHAWQELGQKAPVIRILPAGEVLSRDLLDQVIGREEPSTLVLWDDSTAIPALSSLAGGEHRPESVFLSARYLDKSIWSLSDEIRDFTYLTYPFSFSPTPVRSGMGKGRVQGDLKTSLRQAEVPFKDRIQAISSLTDSLTELLTSALIDLKGNYYRDGLLDVIGSMMAQNYPLYGLVDFGAGQRYAARGCFIVQLAKGEDPQLVKISGWEAR